MPEKENLDYKSPKTDSILESNQVADLFFQGAISQTFEKRMNAAGSSTFYNIMKQHHPTVIEKVVKPEQKRI